jgi:hypothetical protein
MAAEQTAIETNTVNDTPDQKNALVRLSPGTVAYGNDERLSTAREKPKYKNIPEDWKAIPPVRFRKVIGGIEAVLLEISVDGRVTSNPFDWKPTIPTLQAWANHLRSALNELTK